MQAARTPAGRRVTLLPRRGSELVRDPGRERPDDPSGAGPAGMDTVSSIAYPRSKSRSNRLDRGMMKEGVPHEAGASAKPCREPATWCTEVRVARWQGGDDGAFGELYRRFAPLLERRVGFHRLWPLLRGIQKVDVVQEVWLAVSRSRDDFTPSGTGSFFAWVGVIADNTVVRLLRRQSAMKRGEAVVGEGLGEVPEKRIVPRPGLPVLETPTSVARVSELHDLARELLNERQFLAWDLVEIRGYSREEAGLALGCSASAVRGLLLRARGDLVAWFDGRDSD